MGKSKYTDQQIQYIKLRKFEGMRNEDILDAYNSMIGWDKITLHAIRHLVRRYVLHKNAPKASKGKTYLQVTKELSKKKVLGMFLKYVKRKGFIPTPQILASENDVSSNSISQAWGSFERLELEAVSESPELMASIIDETSFTDTKFRDLKKSVANYKRFFITTAVTGCKPHEKAFAAIKTFCDIKSAKLLILPVSDPANQKPRKYKFSLHSNLPDDGVVFRDLTLNSNLFLSTIKLQAKQINPLTGLRGLGQKSSCILASPKQYLEPVPISNKKAIPHHLITTGAITIPEYETKKYVSERTAYLAKDSHVLGGVVVEIKDNKTFFYRHIQFDPKTGSFSDLNTKYHPHGETEEIRAEVIQTGDWHTGSTCPIFKEVTKNIVSSMRPKYMTLEDFFDGSSINPFEKRNIIGKSKRLSSSNHLAGFRTLESELQACSDELSALSNWDCEHIVVKRGNHDDFLHRWLAGADYSGDGVNHYMGVTLAKAMLEDKAPIEFALRELVPFENQNKVRFLKINDSFMVGGIENGVHGHLGAGGKRNPGLRGLDCFGKCNTGHTHSAGIFKGVWRVGTSTVLQLSYNDGASSWSNTLLIQHKDGSRQLVTMVNGEYTI